MARIDEERVEDGNFHHDPVDYSANPPYVRVVSVLADLSLHTQYIQCDLQHVQITSNYTAVSYRWGNESPTHPILIKGKLLNVRDNLWIFLNDARITPRPRKEWFWIDAISIHRENKKERNHQVLQMGQIFRRAQGVAFWLGRDPNDGFRIVFDVIITLRARGFLGPRYGKRQLNVSQEESIRDCDSRGIDPQSFGLVFPDQNTREQFWEAVFTICANEYWSRAWIVQEVIMARQVVLLFETFDILWTDFSDLLIFLLGTPPSTQEISPGLRPSVEQIKRDIRQTKAFWFCNQRGNLKNEFDLESSYWKRLSDRQIGRPLNKGRTVPYQTLEELVTIHRSSHCADLRDRVHSLISLAMDGAGFTVDVSQSLKFAEVLRKALNLTLTELERYNNTLSKNWQLRNRGEHPIRWESTTVQAVSDNNPSSKGMNLYGASAARRQKSPQIHSCVYPRTAENLRPIHVTSFPLGEQLGRDNSEGPNVDCVGVGQFLLPELDPLLSSRLFPPRRTRYSILHSFGIVHRDLKFGNILVVQLDPLRVVITDFGHATTFTNSKDHMKGTISYLPPEIIELKERSKDPKRTPPDPALRWSCKSDVYSYGLVGWALRHGYFKRPVDGIDRIVHKGLLATLQNSRTAADEVLEDMLAWDSDSRLEMCGVLLKPCWSGPETPCIEKKRFFPS
ncbi:hypothetical protein AYO21_03000 [Fonsecaea monophora]|uniref:Protein kinase domain-containing protein n=1 Tax=Fonsecaea monophora TaxID=254056 RepID=A0A177FEY2_9EURO|nr:hypothetical protein AYO21_03000 [Fonsecaea monophora]OAG42717.1 hypothetical protein AYO21_03000 [Fonsecaea monophora]